MVKSSDNEYQSVGEILKDAREKKKLKIATVSAKIRIRTAFLEAMEEGRFSDLPGPTYASGFVRSYASFLGLDQNEIYDKYKEETASEDVKKVLAVHEPEDDEISVPKKKEIFIGIAVLTIICFIWYMVSSAEYETEADVQELSEEAPLVVNEDVSPVAEQETLKPDVEVAPKPTDTTPLKEEVKVDEVAKDKPLEAAAVTKEEESLAAVPATTVASADKSEKAPETRVKLVANSQTWIQVSRDSEILASRILEKGDEYSVPDESGILLRTGNAGGLDVFVDGEKVAPIGPKGTVRTGVLLDAEALLLR